MYKYLKIMHKENIPINLLTLCLGIKYNYLDYADFKGYGLLNFLNEQEALKAASLGIFDARDGIELRERVSSILALSHEKTIMQEGEKWLYVRLVDLRQNEQLDDEELLDKIADIYADFNYPLYMQHFINYMAASIDLSGCTVEQAQKRLISLCDVFIGDLKNKLKCDF